MAKNRKDMEEEVDDCVGSRSENDDDEENVKNSLDASDEIPIHARFLSSLCFTRDFEDGNWDTFLGRDLWSDFRLWCRKNNHKNKLTATMFAKRIMELSENGLCIKKTRKDGHLVFSFDFHALKGLLKGEQWLDEDVW